MTCADHFSLPNNDGIRDQPRAATSASCTLDVIQHENRIMREKFIWNGPEEISWTLSRRKYDARTPKRVRSCCSLKRDCWTMASFSSLTLTYSELDHNNQCFESSDNKTASEQHAKSRGKGSSIHTCMHINTRTRVSSNVTVAFNKISEKGEGEICCWRIVCEKLAITQLDDCSNCC